MTISDLAEYLQVSKSSLYKLVQSGKVTGQKVGKHWRFHKDSIDAWLRSGCPTSTAPQTSHRLSTSELLAP
jgi:excisionase family DNA binding protein